MITFVEKEKWTDKDPFIGRTYAPIYMIKDGKEYFVVNRVVASQELAKEKQDEKSLDEEVRMYQAFLTHPLSRDVYLPQSSEDKILFYLPYTKTDSCIW